jgi:hypothetical protein
MSISSTPYISKWLDQAWLVRVPIGYAHDEYRRNLKYIQKLFRFADFGNPKKAMVAAVQWREENRIPDLKYNDHGITQSNGKLVPKPTPRLRGEDLPVGITDVLQTTRNGGEATMLNVQLMCGRQKWFRSFSYGHSRTRDEAVTLACEKLEEFKIEIKNLSQTSECEGPQI